MRARFPAAGAGAGVGLLLLCSVLIAARAAARPSTQGPAARPRVPPRLRGARGALGAAGLASPRVALLPLRAKAVAALASVGIVALVWRGVRRTGRDPIGPALLVGLNPLVVLYAVGGAHNDLLMMLLAVGGIVLLIEPAFPRPALGGAALAAATAVKASAGRALPFPPGGAHRGPPRAGRAGGATL